MPFGFEVGGALGAKAELFLAECVSLPDHKAWDNWCSLLNTLPRATSGTIFPPQTQYTLRRLHIGRTKCVSARRDHFVSAPSRPAASVPASIPASQRRDHFVSAPDHFVSAPRQPERHAARPTVPRARASLHT